MKKILSSFAINLLLPVILFSQSITYTLSMPEPWTHYFHVTQTIKGERKRSIDFVMPVWIPGSYKVRDYPKNVEGFTAHSDKSENLKWEKLDKNTWRVFSEKAKQVTISYRVYAFEKSVRESFLDDSHGFASPPGLFMYVDNLRGKRAKLVIDPYDDFSTISTGLEASPEDKYTFEIPNYDILIDSPIEIGNQKLFLFDVDGVPHEIAIYGEGNYDSVMVAEIKMITESTIKIFGEIPYKRYVFIVHLAKSNRGAIEHLNSAVYIYGRWNFQPEKKRKAWRSVVAHEMFHTYNVKRIRARALGPFDYTAENYTSLLWVMEGFTSYFGSRILLDAGLLTSDEYREKMASLIKKVSTRKGDKYQSVSAASFDAWIRYYQPNENSRNSEVSYYDKGNLLGMLLDLEIRYSSKNERSLADVMRRLYSEYYKKKKRGFSKEEFKKEVQRAAGKKLDNFFRDYVNGTKEIDYDKYLLYAGLELDKISTVSKATDLLGVATSGTGGKLTITRVVRDSPAWNYGLNVNDEIIAINDLRVSKSDFAKTLNRFDAGEKLKFTLVRNDWLRDIDVVVAESSEEEYFLFPIEEPTELQKAIYESFFMIEVTEEED
ncbi:MAG: M61 family metallopeptidase [Candidatus Marinimicrobia bacterium]|nr:M61 family metallopeptidase [Candidatus Neomarinimicrobiota bacterium]